jgi:hypothetical protein
MQVSSNHRARTKVANQCAPPRGSTMPVTDHVGAENVRHER